MPRRSKGLHNYILYITLCNNIINIITLWPEMKSPALALFPASSRKIHVQPFRIGHWAPSDIPSATPSPHHLPSALSFDVELRKVPPSTFLVRSPCM